MSDDRSVPARVRYINAEWRHRDSAPAIGSRATRHANTSFQDVTIFDARFDARQPANADSFGLDSSGFTLTNHVTSNAANNAELIKNSYYAEMTELVCHVTGAEAAFVMAHQVRTEDTSDFNTAYARFVHTDYHVDNASSMRDKVLAQHNLQADKDCDYVWFNTWQPFDNVVAQNPLAMMDARSLPDEDIIGYRYTAGQQNSAMADAAAQEQSQSPMSGGNGLTAAPIYNPQHRWYYFPLMTPSEVLLIKQLDRRPGRARLCPHTSFDDTTAPADAPPRRSVETRIMAVFGKAA